MNRLGGIVDQCDTERGSGPGSFLPAESRALEQLKPLGFELMATMQHPLSSDPAPERGVQLPADGHGAVAVRPAEFEEPEELQIPGGGAIALQPVASGPWELKLVQQRDSFFRKPIRAP